MATATGRAFCANTERETWQGPCSAGQHDRLVDTLEEADNEQVRLRGSTPAADSRRLGRLLQAGDELAHFGRDSRAWRPGLALALEELSG